MNGKANFIEKDFMSIFYNKQILNISNPDNINKISLSTKNHGIRFY